MSKFSAVKKTDKAGYNELYKGKSSNLSALNNADEYVMRFERTNLSPYYIGGTTKGYVRGLAVSELLGAADSREISKDQITVLDAGCGLGELSVYLACKGFKVIGVDISEEGCRAGAQLAKQVGVAQKCIFFAKSLENIPLPDSSVDFIIGHAALHHFIKYEGVAGEFKRIMKDDSRAFFADGFGENRVYHIFHNKEKMERLGDVTLTKKLITNYFKDFDVVLRSTDWFVMLDKLYERLFPKGFGKLLRHLSRMHFWLDRKIPHSNRVALYLSGAVMTSITKPKSPASGS